MQFRSRPPTSNEARVSCRLMDSTPHRQGQRGLPCSLWKCEDWRQCWRPKVLAGPQLFSVSARPSWAFRSDYTWHRSWHLKTGTWTNCSKCRENRLLEPKMLAWQVSKVSWRRHRIRGRHRDSCQIQCSSWVPKGLDSRTTAKPRKATSQANWQTPGISNPNTPHVMHWGVA